MESENIKITNPYSNKKGAYPRYYVLVLFVTLIAFTCTLALLGANIFTWFGIPELVKLMFKVLLFGSFATIVTHVFFLYIGATNHKKNLKKFILLLILVLPAYLYIGSRIQRSESFQDFWNPCGVQMENCKYTP